MVHGYHALWIFGAAAGFVLPVPQAFAGECEPASAKIALHLTSPATKYTPCGLAGNSCVPDSGMVTAGELEQEYTAFVYLSDWQGEPGVLQVQMGAVYDGTVGSGVDVLWFLSCAPSTTPIGEWPAPGSEIVMNWGLSCQNNSDDEMLVLGTFGLIAHTPGIFSVTRVWALGPNTVPRLVDCEGTEKLIQPNQVSQLAFGELEEEFDTCSGWIDAYPGPCCGPDSCLGYMDLACCWAKGGTTLLPYYMDCADCVTPVLPRTWGQIKSQYK